MIPLRQHTHTHRHGSRLDAAPGAAASSLTFIAPLAPNDTSDYVLGFQLDVREG
jgi:hypothetical protein